MQVKYNSSVKVPAGWRSVEIVATVNQISKAMVEVISVDMIDGEEPNRNQSRTGANRQKFNGKWWASTEVGKKKRISSLQIIN